MYVYIDTVIFYILFELFASTFQILCPYTPTYFNVYFLKPKIFFYITVVQL